MRTPGPFFGPVPGRKPGTRAAPRPPSKLARRIECPQRFCRCGSRCGGAAGARKKPRPGAGLRGPRCTGRAWWPVDLVTWAAPGGPVAVVPGAQLFAPRLVHALAVIRSQVSACVSSYSRAGGRDLVAMVPGPWPVTWWPLPGARAWWPLFVIRWPGAGGRAPRLALRAPVAAIPGPWPAPWWPGRVPAGDIAMVSTH